MSEPNTADLLAIHQRESLGMTHGSPDRCMCGAKTLPAPGDEEVTIRRARAFAEHQAAIIATAVEAERERTQAQSLHEKLNRREADAWVVAVSRLRAALASAAPDALARVKAEALREAARAWKQGGWGDTPRHADRVADRIGAAQYAGDWLEARADRIAGGEA